MLKKKDSQQSKLQKHLHARERQMAASIPTLDQIKSATGFYAVPVIIDDDTREELDFGCAIKKRLKALY